MAGGYHWHYVDGVSDDGLHAIVIIALLGNPFSPAYARARRRGAAASNALAFSAMNVALYSRGASAWSLVERRVHERARTGSGLTIGASTMAWRGDGLEIDIDERTTPLRRPVRGKVILHPEVTTDLEVTLDERLQHRWWPVAPLARIEVDFPVPGLRFSGHGYHDANAGDVPLESTFDRWNWARARSGDRAYVMYDVTCAAGEERSLAMTLSRDGRVEPVEPTWRTPLARTIWGLERQARIDSTQSARVARSLEDGPFYARALLDARLGGRPVVAMHEALAADRLRRRWVRLLTRFRM